LPPFTISDLGPAENYVRDWRIPSDHSPSSPEESSVEEDDGVSLASGDDPLYSSDYGSESAVLHPISSTQSFSIRYPAVLIDHNDGHQTHQETINRPLSPSDGRYDALRAWYPDDSENSPANDLRRERDRELEDQELARERERYARQIREAHDQALSGENPYGDDVEIRASPPTPVLRHWQVPRYATVAESEPTASFRPAAFIRAHVDGLRTQLEGATQDLHSLYAQHNAASARNSALTAIFRQFSVIAADHMARSLPGHSDRVERIISQLENAEPNVSFNEYSQSTNVGSDYLDALHACLEYQHLNRAQFHQITNLVARIRMPNQRPTANPAADNRLRMLDRTILDSIAGYRFADDWTE
jgi:hypothetical protein